MNDLKAAVEFFKERITAETPIAEGDNLPQGLVDMARHSIKLYTTALAALQDVLQRQPDPDTGLVPCGCGGKVEVAFYPGWHGVPDMYHVDCFNCHVGTRPCQTAEQAKASWNTAMGWKGGAE